MRAWSGCAEISDAGVVVYTLTFLATIRLYTYNSVAYTDERPFVGDTKQTGTFRKAITLHSSRIYPPCQPLPPQPPPCPAANSPSTSSPATQPTPSHPRHTSSQPTGADTSSRSSSTKSWATHRIMQNRLYRSSSSSRGRCCGVAWRRG